MCTSVKFRFGGDQTRRGPLPVVGVKMPILTASAALVVVATAYTQAVEEAVGAAAAYYAAGTSPLDDDAYELLVRGIAAWETEHPDQVLPDSPTGKVAGGAVEGNVPLAARDTGRTGHPLPSSSIANEVRMAAGGGLFANRRNAAASTLRVVERAYTAPMTFHG